MTFTDLHAPSHAGAERSGAKDSAPAAACKRAQQLLASPSYITHANLHLPARATSAPDQRKQQRTTINVSRRKKKRESQTCVLQAICDVHCQLPQHQAAAAPALVTASYCCHLQNSLCFTACCCHGSYPWGLRMLQVGAKSWTHTALSHPPPPGCN